MSSTAVSINEPIPAKPIDRRLVLVAGVTLLASLGSVYAWSFFTIPLQSQFLWSKAQVSLVFSFAVAGLGFSALYTGPLVSKLGGRLLMKRSTLFFVAGYLIAAFGLWLGSGILGDITTPWVSWLSFVILAFGYGAVGGIGLGVGYVSAIATVAGWFPDKKGFATGFIVMGFGMGALFMSKVFAPFAMKLTSGNVAAAFLVIACTYAVIMGICCRFIYSPSMAASGRHVQTVGDTFEHPVNVRVRLWLVVFFYSVAGLGIISILSPLMQAISASANPALSSADLAVAGATLIAIASIGNSVGRLFWAWVSDGIGRVNTFVILLTSSAVVYLILPHVASPVVFGILICYAIASFGGAFGTVPSLISDLFGPKRLPALHGLVLTGWATAGLMAPPFFGYLNDRVPEQAASIAFYICAIAILGSTALVITFKRIHKVCIVPA